MVIEFPMVEEGAATGRVAAVYAAASERAPFVPSLLKSLAVCPPYLVLAWEQVGPLLDDPALAQAGSQLTAQAERAATPPAAQDDRRLLAGFADPIAKMLLVSCGLLAALDGDLGKRPSATGTPPPQPRGPLEADVPATRDLVQHADVLGRIRGALGTPIVNSIWRHAAAEGRLERVWDALEPQAAGTRGDAERLREAAERAARQLPWRAIADRASLDAAGIADAETGMRVVLDAYAVTLARVLVLIASSGAARDDER